MKRATSAVRRRAARVGSDSSSCAQPADGHRDPPLGDLDPGIGHRGPDLLRDRHRLVACRAVEDRHELLAAGPRDEVADPEALTE